mmetsp:Transcript_38276/g.94792  ORF Transcript_38276/g.94792 Transcript_38276/m.94792 type:complete len:234 (-) Transcript_38276:819-1520(-)
MSVIAPMRTLIPADVSPAAWRLRNSVTMLMADRPAFSASVYGTTSSACEYILRQYASVPPKELAKCANLYDASASGAPPPGVSRRFLTRQRSTHKASWIERSHSSSTMRLDARTKMVTVLPGLGTPVTRMIFDSGVASSATVFAEPSFSATKDSMEATGWQPTVLQMNSTSSRSMSVTTRILSLARKCSDRSVTASRRMLFCTSSTLQPVLAICLHMSRMYLRSSLRMRSICA